MKRNKKNAPAVQESMDGWVKRITGEEEVEKAKALVEQAMTVAKAVPFIGTVTMMVGPGGLMNVSSTPNFQSQVMTDALETALLDLQKVLIASRRKSSGKEAEPAVEQAEEAKEE